MGISLFPTVNELTMIGLLKTPYATGVMHLYKSALAFDPALVAADFAAVEADFSGYVAITLTTLPAAYIDQVNGGVSFTVPTKQWLRTLGTPDVGNDIFGMYFLDAGGLLLMAYQFATPWPMQSPSDALPLEMTFNFFGTNLIYGTIQGNPT